MIEKSVTVRLGGEPRQLVLFPRRQDPSICGAQESLAELPPEAHSKITISLKCHDWYKLWLYNTQKYSSGISDDYFVTVSKPL